MWIRTILVVAPLFVALWSQPPAVSPSSDDGPLLPRPELLRVLFGSARELVADFFWIKTTHQIGVASTAAEARDVFHYANLVTDLDPRFYQVYPFAAIALPWSLGREKFANTEYSSRLIRKGLRQFPDDFKLRSMLAYNLMFFDRDYLAAAKLVSALAEEPKAPRYFAPLATRLYAQAGEVDLGMELAVSLRDAAEDPEERAFYERRLLELEQERILRTLDEAVRGFREVEGRLPGAVGELTKSGFLKALPPDPLGGEFFIDKTGTARSTSLPMRLQLIEEEKKARLREMEILK